jgi:hypothetical protein
MNLNRLLLSLLILFAALGIQFRSGELLGWSLDAVLPVLLALAFWDTISEYGILIIISIIFLNWRPGISPELLFFGVYPLLVFFVRPHLPVGPKVILFSAIGVGIVAFYLVIGGKGIFSSGAFLWKDVLASMLIGLATFKILETINKKDSPKRGVLYALPR